MNKLVLLLMVHFFQSPVSLTITSKTYSTALTNQNDELILQVKPPHKDRNTRYSIQGVKLLVEYGSNAKLTKKDSILIVDQPTTKDGKISIPLKRYLKDIHMSNGNRVMHIYVDVKQVNIVKGVSSSPIFIPPDQLHAKFDWD